MNATVLEALDHLRNAVTVFDAEERLLYCNAHYNYLFRSLPPRESLIGSTYESLIRLELAGAEIADIHLRDPESFTAQRRQQLLEGDFRPFDIHLVDGRIVELKARRTGSDRRIILWSDVTCARKLLARLEDTVELSVDAFAYWDECDRLAFCNTAFAGLHGLASLDDARGLTFAELMERAARRGKFVIDGPITYWLERRIEAHCAPVGALTISTSAGSSYLVRERKSRGGGAITVLTDVSERQRAESAFAEQTLALERTKRALRESKSEAERKAGHLADLTRRLGAAEYEADTAKTTLLRAMGHELKTPLNAIIGFSDLLRSAPERFKAEQIGEYANLIFSAGGNLLRVIDQIVVLAKIAANQYPLRRARVSVAAAFANALDLNAAQMGQKSLDVKVSYGAGDLFADADEGALAAMIGHLVENAAAYTQSGGTICLSAVQRGGFIRITIADNGPGVAARDLARILEPFEHAGCGAPDRASAGLGLPIVKALAELHGGTFGVSSIPGEGFTAIFEIPSA